MRAASSIWSIMTEKASGLGSVTEHSKSTQRAARSDSLSSGTKPVIRSRTTSLHFPDLGRCWRDWDIRSRDTFRNNLLSIPKLRCCDTWLGLKKLRRALMNKHLRFVIPGGNGQVGTVLSRYLHAQGHEVIVLARNVVSAPWRIAQWDGEHLGAWTSELEHSDVLVNLAGKNVNCRYTAANRKAIINSRTETTRLLGRAIGQLASPPRLWMNASTATIYRHIYDRPMDEETGEIGGNEPDAPDKWKFSID